LKKNTDPTHIEPIENPCTNRQNEANYDATLQNFIFIDTVDLESVQRNNKKETREFIGHQVNLN